VLEGKSEKTKMAWPKKEQPKNGKNNFPSSFVLQRKTVLRACHRVCRSDTKSTLPGEVSGNRSKLPACIVLEHQEA
jgi:hypothetical protein